MRPGPASTLKLAGSAELVGLVLLWILVEPAQGAAEVLARPGVRLQLGGSAGGAVI